LTSRALDGSTRRRGRDPVDGGIPSPRRDGNVGGGVRDGGGDGGGIRGWDEDGIWGWDGSESGDGLASVGDGGEGSARRGGGTGRGICGVPRALRLLRLSSFRALKKDADLVAGRRRRERVLRRGTVDGLRWRSDVRGDTRGDGLGGPGGPGPGGGMDARVHPCLGRENRAVRDPRAGLCGGRDEAEGSLWRGNGRFRPTVSLRGGYVARGTGESDIQATDGGSRAQSGRDVSQANITRRKRG